MKRRWVVSWLALVVSAWGATYYIDYEQGLDTQNGLSKTAAWKRHPYMQHFSGTYTHQAGDVFIFKGGVTWRAEAFCLHIPAGGNASAYDRYTVDKTWYTGSAWTQPIFDGENQVPTNASYSSASQSMIRVYHTQYVLIDNLEVKRMGTGAEAGATVGSIHGDASTHCRVRNCHVHDWHPVNTWDGDYGGIFFFTVIESCRIHATVNDSDQSNGCGIFNNDTTRYNEIYDIQCGMRGGGMIYNNHIHHTKDSFNPDTHEDGVDLRSSAQFFNNVVHDVQAGVLFFLRVPWAKNALQNEVYIYNNVIYNNSPAYISMSPFPLDPGGTISYYIYNNVYQIGNGSAIGLGGGTPAISNLMIKNNVYIGTAASMVSFFPDPTVRQIDHYEIDYNLYYSAQGANVGMFGPGYAPTATYTTSKAMGYNLHSLLAPSAIDYSYRPYSAGDPGVDQGRDLSSIFNFDQEWTIRPQGMGWDIGAYEYSINKIADFGLRKAAYPTQPLWPNPIKAAFFNQYPGLHNNLQARDITGKTVNEFRPGLYLVQDREQNAVLQKIIVR